MIDQKPHTDTPAAAALCDGRVPDVEGVPTSKVTAQGEAGHGGHASGVAGDTDRRYLWVALLLLLTFMLGEVVVAVISGSLALLSDAGHMLSDVGAIGASLWAIRLAARPASGAWTFGWKRAEILSAAGNGITLLVVAGIVGYEAIRRLFDPPPVEGGPVLVVALVGVAVNIAAAWVLAKANRSSLNVEGAYQHILTDLYAFIGTVIAAIVILTTGYLRADAIASLVVVALMLKAAWGLLRDSGRVLLEAAPRGVDLDQIRSHLLENEHVHDVHDLHVWTVTSSLPTLSAHVVIDDSCFSDGHAPQLLDTLQACLGGHFDVQHSTFQLEPASHADHEPETH
ncbi:MAG: cation transporter [Actinomycetales bacterium]|nr:cation transporter [Actinomycetales bacterium]